ncbi:ubiquitin fusion degradation protein 1 [Diutina catenulata]
MFSGFGGMFGGGFGMPQASNHFEDHFRCYPIAMMNDTIRKDDANYGDKIFLPPSTLNKLTMLHIRYPMLFSLTNETAGKNTHSGVLEFVAEEGRVYIPQWMMATLGVNPGQIISVTNCDLPNGQYVKIEPQSVDFLDISDPKAVLENVFRKFTTLTVGDVIEVNYNDQIYGVKVLEVKPENSLQGICIIETDLETDFAPPVGYVEPDYKSSASVSKSATPAPIDPKKVSRGAGAATMAHSINYANLVADGNRFTGGGQKLSGKPADENKKRVTVDELDPNAPAVRLDLPENQLFFGFPVVLPTPEEIEEADNEPAKFGGAGQSLRQSRKRKGKGEDLPSPKSSRSPQEFIEID